MLNVMRKWEAKLGNVEGFVFSQDCKKFTTFESLAEFLDWYPGGINCNEVILESTSTKVYFDIDRLPDGVCNALTQYLCAASEYFVQNWGEQVTWQVACASDGDKISYHVVSKQNVGFRNHAERTAFKHSFKVFLETHHAHLVTMFDSSVYNKRQNFRLVYSVDLKEHRRKLIPLPECSQSVHNHLVVMYSTDTARFLEFNCQKPIIPEEVQVSVIRCNDRRVDTIINQTQWWGKTAGVRSVGKGPRGLYYKLDTRYCIFAKRIHTRNTNYIWYDPTLDSFSVRCFCERCVGCETFVNEADLYDSEWHEDYESPSMREYTHILATTSQCIQANMAIGKTETLYGYMEAHPGARTLLVTFRIALAHKYCEDLANRNITAVNYQASKCLDEENVLVICLNSLWRLNHVEYDVVIFDELDSILEALDMNMQFKGQTCDNMKEILRLATVVFFLDANLDNSRCRNFIKRTRPPHTHKWVRNRYVRKANRHLTVYKDQRDAHGKWCTDRAAFGKVLQLLDCGKKVVFLTTGKQVARAMERLVPGSKRYKIFTADTDPAQKQADFKDVNASFRELDLLIYNPAMSAGISMVDEHFDVLVAHARFGLETCSVYCFLQMLWRVRRLREGAMHLYLHNEVTYNLCENPAVHIAALERREEYMMKLLRGVIRDRNIFKMGADGRRKFMTECPMNMLFIDNIVQKRIGLNNYEQYLIEKLQTRYAVTVSDVYSGLRVRNPLADAPPAEGESMLEIPKQWDAHMWTALRAQYDTLSADEKTLVEAGSMLKRYCIPLDKLDLRFIVDCVGHHNKPQARAKATERFLVYQRYLKLVKNDIDAVRALVANEPRNAMDYFENSNRHYVKLLEVYAIFEKLCIQPCFPEPCVIQRDVFSAARAAIFPNNAALKSIMHLFGIRSTYSWNDFTDRRYRNALCKIFAAVGVEIDAGDRRNAARNCTGIRFHCTAMQAFMGHYGI